MPAALVQGEVAVCQRAPAKGWMHGGTSACRERRRRGVAAHQGGVQATQYLRVRSGRRADDRGAAGERLGGRQPEALELLGGHDHEVGRAVPANELLIGYPTEDPYPLLQAERLDALADPPLHRTTAGERQARAGGFAGDQREGLDELADACARHHPPGREQQRTLVPRPRMIDGWARREALGVDPAREQADGLGTGAER